MAIAITLSRPTIPSSWNPIYLISNVEGSGNPREYPIPSEYLPSDLIYAYSDISGADWFYANFNDLIALTLLSATGPVGGTAGLTMGILVDMLASFRRIESTTDVFGKAYFNSLPSPRLGYSIGTMFKHQGYVGTTIYSVGVTLVGAIQWIGVFVTSTYVEYYFNCIFRQMYAKTGRILDVGTADESSSEESDTYYVKLFEKSGPFKFWSPPSGIVHVYDGRGGITAFDVKGIREGWYVKLVRRSGSGVPAAGQAYELTNIWVIDDPNLLHEFDVSVDSDGLYRSKEQGGIVKDISVVGIWHPDPNNETLWKLYSDVPSTPQIGYLPERETESVIRQESMSKGTFSEGVSMMKPTDATSRILMSKVGGNNWFGGCLTGQMVEQQVASDKNSADFSVGRFFEIVSHPRRDTIEISMKAVDNSDARFDIKKPFTIRQHKFWMINELYPTGNGLWEGKVSSVVLDAEKGVNKTTVKWVGSEGPDIAMDDPNFPTLARRIRSPLAVTSGTMVFYKCADWRLCISGSDTEFVVEDAIFVDLGKSGRSEVLSITATLVGDAFNEIPAGTKVFLAMGPRYRRSWPSPFAALTGYPALGAPTGWKIFVDGYYDSSAYVFDSEIPQGTTMALTSHSWGYNGLPTGVPAIMMSTRAKLRGVSCTEEMPSRTQHVFYSDQNLSIAVFRSGNKFWNNLREERAVVLGFPGKLQVGSSTSWSVPSSVGTTTSLTTSSIITSASGWFDPDPGAKKGGSVQNIYWLKLPESSATSSCPYFSAVINGNGGIDTPLTRRDKIGISATTYSPASLPFEMYPPVKSGGQSSPKIKSKTSSKSYSQQAAKYPCHWRAGTLPASACFELASDQKLQALAAGSAVAGGSCGVHLDGLEYADETHVISNMQLHDVFAADNEMLTLVYGQQSPDMVAGDGSDPTSSMPCVMMVQSPDSGNTWWSPKFRGQPPSASSDDQKKQESALPLMLLRDFTYARSTIDPITHNCWIFGYGYARDESGNSQDGRSEYLFLGMYKFELPTLADSETQLLRYNTASGQPVRPYAYYRSPPGIADSEDFGRIILGELEPPDNVYQEYFVRIAGGPKSGALNKHLKIGKDVISVDGTGQGMRIFLRDDTVDGIIALIAPGDRYSWGVAINDDERFLIYARGALAPTFSDGYLFYFQGTALMSKNLDVSPQGSFASQQELLDSQPTAKIADGVQPHKVAVNTTSDGETTVYYMSSGHVSAARTSNRGYNWHAVKNW